MPASHRATAFISCSLRTEDEPFVRLVEQILIHHKIKPIGTVGRHSARPQNPLVHMRSNINKADMVVVAATTRYMQQDVGTGITLQAPSEMVQIEAAMAYAKNKPIVVLAHEGTNLGGMFHNITQPIYLSGGRRDLLKKQKLISSLLQSAIPIINRRRLAEGKTAVRNIAVNGLAIGGAIGLLNWIFNRLEEDDKQT